MENHIERTCNVKVGVFGCVHGDVDEVYEAVKLVESKHHINIDLVLVTGDYQAVRDQADLECLACPRKFWKLGSFQKYYLQQKVAPKLTIVIGGNHEASSHLRELRYGGWLAPNMYYLGDAGCISVLGLRIAGLSGIFKPYDYSLNHFENSLVDNDEVRSCYHVRELDVFKLSQLSGHIDCIMSHDWPAGITCFGDEKRLLRYKPDFEADIRRNALGNPHTFNLLQQLRPSYWFSGHMHCLFAAKVPHKGENSNDNDNDTEGGGGESSVPVTKFLALDKIRPRAEFMRVVDVKVRDSSTTTTRNLSSHLLSHDKEWLAITKAADMIWGDIAYANNKFRIEISSSPQNRELFANALQQAKEQIDNDFPSAESLIIKPENMIATFEGAELVGEPKKGTRMRMNPQDAFMISLLKLNKSGLRWVDRHGEGGAPPSMDGCGEDVQENPEAMNISDDDE